MIKGKELIVATEKYAKDDRRKSWSLLITTMLIFSISMAGAIINSHIIFQLFSGVLAGLMFIRFFIMYHDYLHKSILQNSVIAEGIFTLFGLFILAPVSIWRRSHNYHHAHNSKLYTSSIGSYPIVTKEQFLKANKMERGLYLFARHPLTMTFGYLFVFIWGMSMRSLIQNPKKHWDSLLALVLHIAMGAAIYFNFGWQSLLAGFFLPFLVGHAMGAYLFYAQHNFPSAVFRSKQEWDYVHAALYSSSYMKMSPLMEWFTGNIGYHHIHHINPRIPFYNLPKAHKDIEQLQVAGTTSLKFKDISACCRLKVWDPDQGKMIGKSEIYAA